MLVGYGIVSFAVLQVIEPIMHALHLPEVTLTYVVLALAVGFPVAGLYRYPGIVLALLSPWLPPEPCAT